MGQCFQFGGLRISAFADDVVELASSAGVLQLTLEQDEFLPKVEDFKCLRVLFTSDGIGIKKWMEWFCIRVCATICKRVSWSIVHPVM